MIVGSRAGPSTDGTISFNTSDQINVVLANTSTITTTSVYRDTSAWYHIVVQTTQSGNSILYVNGVQAGSTSVGSSSWLFNSSNTNTIGRYGADSLYYFDGYLTEINFIDGQALTPSSFGETDAVTGRWKAKAFSGSYGTNGFYLKFADNSSTAALGTDSSGNGNTWTVNNFVVSPVDGADNDSLVDSPTNYGSDSGVGGEVRGNYATLNPLKTDSVFTLANGNFDFSATSSAISGFYLNSSIGVSSGKWYWEVTPSSVGAGPNIAIGIRSSSDSSTSGSAGFFLSGYGYNASGNKVDNSTSVAYGSSYTNSDIIGIALDMNAGTIVFYKNNTTQGTAFSGISGTFEPSVSFTVGGVSRTIAGSVNFGQRPFAYTAPSGFKALCTTNLTTPTIKKPSSYMDVVTYTGTGASNSISSLGFSPDLVWIKNRGGATSHALYDTVRGVQVQLSSDTTGTEVTSSTGLTAFGSNGFTIGTSTLVNTSGTQYVAWSWDAGSSDATNNSGSITSTVRANPQTGFSIVSATMPNLSSPQTVGHGLGVAPKMIIAKFRSAASNWNTYHSSLGATKIIFFNSTDASVSDATRWDNTEPTSSVFTLGSAFVPDASLNTLIAYCFAEIEGFSKFGSYTGNGSADGPFVYCGFRPRWVMTKRTDNSFGGDWYIYDSARNTFNAINNILYANGPNAESSSVSFDFTSNGFKVRSSASNYNASGGTYIFAAFAEQPFKYARAR
jgi:hypothetical protein